MTIMVHHEMTMGTTWDDDYDGAMKWLRELHENMQKVTRNYTELLDFFSKKFKKIVLWSEAWFKKKT
jgi:hypothetical protein